MVLSKKVKVNNEKMYLYMMNDVVVVWIFKVKYKVMHVIMNKTTCRWKCNGNKMIVIFLEDKVDDTMGM